MKRSAVGEMYCSLCGLPAGQAPEVPRSSEKPSASSASLGEQRGRGSLGE